jgi:hypothetical protein
MLAGGFSPDGQFISFSAWADPTRIRVFWTAAMPTVREEQWIPVTDESSSAPGSQWSNTGDMLFFTSNRDGFWCLWGQRIGIRSRRSIGPPFAVRHFHSAALRMAEYAVNRIAVGGSRLAFCLNAATGNIWSYVGDSPRQ